MKLIINNNYTYETDFKLKIGDEVLLPTPSFLRDGKGDTWKGKVTSLNSDNIYSTKTF